MSPIKKHHVHPEIDGFVLEEGKSKKEFFTLEGLIQAVAEYPNLSDYRISVKKELIVSLKKIEEL